MEDKPSSPEKGTPIMTSESASLADNSSNHNCKSDGRAIASAVPVMIAPTTYQGNNESSPRAVTSRRVEVVVLVAVVVTVWWLLALPIMFYHLRLVSYILSAIYMDDWCMHIS